jgi:DNA-binding transcriptional LysR family regulator
MFDKLRSMQVFATVAATSSFAQAAEQLGMSAVMVGKHVQKLEQALGATLLERTTRTRALSVIGARYLERCRAVLASVEQADRVAETLRAEPQGLLRISAPVAYGSQRLAGVVALYQMAHPKVTVDLALNDRVIDLQDEGIDIALRTGAVTDPHLIARPLAPMHLLATASPAYLERHGLPRHPGELQGHHCLHFAPWGANAAWRFTRAGETVKVGLAGRFSTNQPHALLAAGLAGLGVLVQNDAMLEPYLRSGALVRLLPEWSLPSRQVTLVRRAEHQPSAKIRSFVDFVVERLGAPQAVSAGSA